MFFPDDFFQKRKEKREKGSERKEKMEKKVEMVIEEFMEEEINDPPLPPQNNPIKISPTGNKPSIQNRKKMTKKHKRDQISEEEIKHWWNLFESDASSNPGEYSPIPSELQVGEFHLVGDENEMDLCKECNSILIQNDEGFYSCSNTKCAVMYMDIMDQTAEWRFFGSENCSADDPTRCGVPINPLLKESSFGGRMLATPGASYEMRKIKRYIEWQSMPYKEKSQYDDFQTITVMAQNAGINKNIIDDAIQYYKKISEHKTFRGLNRDGILAASIYISCRINDNPRTAKEIAGIFNLDHKCSTKGCKNAMFILNNQEHQLENDEKTVLCLTRPESFIDRFCSKLNITQEMTRICQFVAIQIDKHQIIPENTPHSIAAGIIYFISFLFGLNIGKRDIHVVSEISEVTINKCFHKLVKHLKELIPDMIIQKYNIIQRLQQMKKNMANKVIHAINLSKK